MKNHTMIPPKIDLQQQLYKAYGLQSSDSPTSEYNLQVIRHCYLQSKYGPTLHSALTAQDLKDIFVFSIYDLLYIYK